MKNKTKKRTALIMLVVYIFLLTPVLAADYDGHWAKEYIDQASARGWITGYSDGTFLPDQVINRAEFATILWRVLGKPQPQGESPFTDVSETDWYHDAVVALYEAGIISGYGGGLYGPLDEQTREMSFCVLARASGLEPVNAEAYKDFTDHESVSSWARSDVSAMIEAGYVSGSGGKLLPADGLKRGEAAKLFVLIYVGETELRIVCLAPSMVEVVYALGFGDDIVGWSQYTDYPIEVTERDGWVPYEEYEFISIEDELKKDVAVVSTFYTYNAELIDALNPTLILAESGTQMFMYEELTEKGYNVLHHDPQSLDEVYEMMISIGDALGAKDVAATLVEGYRQEIEEIVAITSQLPQVKVYYEIAHRTYYGDTSYGPYTAGSGTPFDQMVEIAGGVNVFDDLEGGYAQVEYEDIIEADPDVILSPMWPNAMDYEVTTIYEIMTREGFSDISAVQTSRVLFYDSSLFKRYGPRTITAIKKLAYILHPYYFENPENSVSPWELGKIDVFYPIPSPLR